MKTIYPCVILSTQLSCNGNKDNGNMIIDSRIERQDNIFFPPIPHERKK